MGSQDETTQRSRRRKIVNKRKKWFFIPTTKEQFKLCAQRFSFHFFNCVFKIADKAMYLLGPVLIAVASTIIVGLTYVYLTVILPMLTGSNWVHTNDDWDAYWKMREEGREDANNNAAAAAVKTEDSTPISTISSVLLALSTPTGIAHTLLVLFFLINVLYNYYQCVITSNSGPAYDLVVQELAEATGFQYPQTEEELVQCKKDFEKKIYEKVQQRRNAIMASRNRNTAAASRTTSPPLGMSNNATSNGDVESQTSSSSSQSPLMATSTIANPATTAPTSNNHAPLPPPPPPPQPLPKIHNWQLLSPIEWGYCRYSSRPKPPRSHYDHVTKSLVLNMDHYCPWMFNCVGYFNYRYFFNFLWFVVVGLSYGTIICFPAFMKLGGKEYRDQVRASSQEYQKGDMSEKFVVKHLMDNPYVPTPDERTPVALGFMLCLCLAAAVMCLGVFHLYLVLSAQTTIEFHGNWTKRRNKKWKNPYSAGSWRENWTMIYGTRYWSSRHHHRKLEDEEETEEQTDQYRYRGCWGIFLAMMPSNRQPEFLPIPINGKLVRRERRTIQQSKKDEEIDLEMAVSREVIPNGLLYSGESSNSGLSNNTSSSETEYLMESKDMGSPLTGRARTKKTTHERIV